MTKKNVLNMLAVVAAVLLMGVFAFTVRLEAAADAVAVLKTTGMTCGSCAAKIEGALKGSGGVSSVEVDVATGTVMVGYDSRQATPDALAGVVTSTGYGCAVAQVITPEQYQSLRGETKTARAGGCGGGCCPKNRPVDAGTK